MMINTRRHITNTHRGDSDISVIAVGMFGSHYTSCYPHYGDNDIVWRPYPHDSREFSDSCLIPHHYHPIWTPR